MRCTGFLLLTLLASVALAVAAPTPKAASSGPLYAPTKVGTRWTEALKTDKGVIRTTVWEVTDAKEKGGEWTVTVTGRVSDDRQPRFTKTVVVSEKGVTHREGEGTPYSLLRTPVKADATWTEKIRPEGGGVEIVHEYRIVGQEKVKVPAGEFDAVKVEMEVKGLPNAAVKNTFWLVAGVGVVKEAQKVNRQAPTTTEMGSFEAGKE